MYYLYRILFSIFLFFLNAESIVFVTIRSPAKESIVFVTIRMVTSNASGHYL